MAKTGEIQSTYWVLKRVLATLLLLLVFALSVFGLHEFFEAPGRGVTISVSLLFGLPFTLGAIAAFLNNPTGEKPGISNAISGPLFAISVLIIGGIVIREGVICMIILTPLWLGSAAFGAGLVSHFHKRFRERSKLNCSVLICIPFLLMFGESYVPQQVTEYTVERSIIIKAPVDKVWDTLSVLDNISEDEGKWNFTQNILGVPRPKSAVVIGSGVGATRYAQWGEHITFEEHISQWDHENQMIWDFVFPNSSIRLHTDRHISPDGAI